MVATSRLAQAFLAYRARRDIVVVAITPRAFAVAKDLADALRVPSDIFLVHEIAGGAVARGAYIPFPKQLASGGISLSEFVDAASREEAAIAAEEAHYRSGRAAVSLTGTTVILVDDADSDERALLTAMTAIRRHGINGIIVVTPLESNLQRERP